MRFALLTLLSFVICACSSTRNSAPIVDRSPKVESKPAPVSAPPPAQPAASAAPAHATRLMDSHGYYIVKKGDTLLQIALDFGQSYRDLVTWNNLANPNDIRVDQALRVIPPGASVVAVASPVQPVTAIDIKPTVGMHKSGPRGEKQPYSEAALAEMQKPDVPLAIAVKPETRPTEKPVEKPIEAASATSPEDASVSWIWPTDGKVVAAYDEGKRGIDINGKMGQLVIAAASGKVMYAGSGIRGYGNLVIVKHTTNLLSAYAHNKTILVKEGQNVGKGEKIAEMGNTDADAVKLHFEIRQQGKPVDPSKFLPSR